MGAAEKIEPVKNLAIWNALATTDPKHTKGFKRAGGFTGTAIKPIWTIKRLTELFGPIGIGWGMGKPTFDIVHATEGEVAVYCTVECWHTAPENTFYGVGGDKAVGKNKYGLSVDDEAFKKAFTDAVGNAFKFVGVAADVHMGLFDDSKYVRQAEREFAERRAVRDKAESAVSPDGLIPDYDAEAPQEAPKRTNWGGRYPNKTKLHAALVTHEAELQRLGETATLDDLNGYITAPEYADFITTALDHAPHYLEGGLPAPPEFPGIYAVEQKARDLIAIRGNVALDMGN